MRYKISPSMNRNLRLQSLGSENAFRSTGVITVEGGTTNYTTTNASHGHSPQRFFRRASHDILKNNQSPTYNSNMMPNGFTNGYNMLNKQFNDGTTVPDLAMDAPYVNKIGPGQHTYINTFDVPRQYYVNRYQNSPCFSFPKTSKVDFRFNNSPTRQEYTSLQNFREKVDRNYDQMLKSASPSNLYSQDSRNNNGEFNQYASQLVHEAFHKFGG